jgi:hypothetical protein
VRSDTKIAEDRADLIFEHGEDWQDYLREFVRGAGDLEDIVLSFISKWKDRTVGQGVLPKEITEHKEKWEKLTRLLM